MTTTQAAQMEWEIAPAEAESAMGHGHSSGLKPLWQIFDEVAAKHADRTAITFGDEAVSYRDLQLRASELARRLRGLGVGPDVLVGVYLERSPRAIVALLAVLKAGGAYLPLDPAYPSERVAMILEDARPAVLLTEERLLDRLPSHGAQAICLDRASGPDSVENKAEIVAGSGLENLAYVIYTSGSTGKPKGVMVTQANLARLLSATEAWFHFSERDVWTLFHSVAFDFSVWEIWGCLLYGGRLVIVPFAVSRSPEDFYELLEREQVTVLNQTPSAFYQLIAVDQMRHSPNLALRVVVFGGEALNFRSLRPWFAAHGDQTPRLINMYGITETTVHVTYREVTTADAAEGAHSLIGVPIPDLQLYVLDSERQRVAAGETGEIYVGGAGVARGYLNRLELNAERFLPDTFSGTPGALLYKSGDLARFLADGELEYLGRGDEQVKIQGFRIELGEVEAALVGHTAVREARVIAHTDAAGTKRLVAYYVAEEGGTLPARQLSEYLGAKLPPWMMPSLYMPVEAFPLTPHGKVDYAALPKPVAGTMNDARPAVGVVNAEASGTDLELEVARVWRTVLGAEHVGLDDNFFDIGGTSLLLVAVHGKLQTLLERRISVADLFAYTTVRALAASLVSAAPGSSAGAGMEQNSVRDPAREAGQRNAAQAAVQDQAQKQRAAFARARAMKRAAL